MANNLIVCGGTFDRFHKGHESLLRLAFSLGKKVLVGITSDRYVKNLKIEDRRLGGIESFNKRKQSVLNFIKNERVLDKLSTVEINDLFGPTLSKDLLIDSIVVSENTKKGAELINQKRKELNLCPLKIFIAPSIETEDGKFLSSARIRNGEINRLGRPNVNPLWLEKDLIILEELKKELKEPFGKIVEDINREKDVPYVITVGDATTKKFNEKSAQQDISVVDFKIAREVVFSSTLDLGFSNDEIVFVVDNPAGHIMHGLFSKILEIFRSNAEKRVILKIVGEDDLVVLPLILVAPLNTVIYYGQPGVGLVKIVVSEDSKLQAYNLVAKFRPI